MCFDFRDVPSAGFLCFFAACRKGASAVCRDILEAVLELHLRSSIAFVKHKNVGRQILCLIGGKLCRNEAENQLDRGVLPKGHSPSFQGCLLDIWKTPFFPQCFIADPDSRQAWEPFHYKLVLHQIQSSYLFWRVHVPLYLNPPLFTHSLKINKSRRLKDRVSFKLNFDEEDFLPRITAPRDNSYYERRIQRYQFFDSTWGVWARN